MHPEFSRWMPPAPEQSMRRKAIVVLTALAVASLALFYIYPILLAVAAGLVLLVVLLLVCENAIDNRRLHRLATGREGESICTFVRAFNRRAPHFDPHIVRAVWDVLEPYVSWRGGRVPLRPDDRLETDLRIDWEDLEDDFRTVALRVRRSTANTEENPLYGRVSTVADLVVFLSFQARCSAA